jgi:hypothetical protein
MRLVTTVLAARWSPDRGHTSAGIPIPAQPRHRSRSQGWPKATRRAPASDAGEDGATITSRDADTPRNATMSRDTC